MQFHRNVTRLGPRLSTPPKTVRVSTAFSSELKVIFLRRSQADSAPLRGSSAKLLYEWLNSHTLTSVVGMYSDEFRDGTAENPPWSIKMPREGLIFRAYI